ncbi:hypothetical protein GCM10012287_36650 [Streptomyces daqingensis]|uniref:Uncharacterized protein n=1 Tax=Streptomyces daqingensis TaxID=1472640 RepID=A0ABQ2MLN3_9ACTN|nr:hypothetical protein GCM10012287_36650 [Streptomyces daqingensis]
MVATDCRYPPNSSFSSSKPTAPIAQASSVGRRGGRTPGRTVSTYHRSAKSAATAAPYPAALSSTEPSPPSRRPSWPATQLTALTANAEPPSETSPTAPSPASAPKSFSFSSTGFPGSSSRSHTERRLSRSVPTQLTPVTISASPAIRPIVPALSANDWRSSCLEMPGTWRLMVCWTVRMRSGDSSEAPTAAKTASIGKSEMKLVKVTDAASRSHLRSSRCR